MSFKNISKLFAGMLLGVAAGASIAGPIVWDVSPLTHGTVNGDNWTNTLSGRHYADKVILAQTTLIVGMDIYMHKSFGALNDQATISIWKNRANAPGALVASFQSVVSAIDNLGASASNKRVHVDFGGFTMLAGEAYWIGMSPKNASWAQTALRNVAGGTGNMAQFNGAPFSGMTGIGDMAFRLHAPNPVPEPASLALFGLGLLGIAAARRRKYGFIAAC